MKNLLQNLIVVLSISSVLLGGCSHRPARMQTLSGAAPIIIAHRGASGYMPEHTLEGYERAIQMGADFIEPDLVMTKDHQLVVRHENEISGTTNVAEVYPKRKKTKTVDGEVVTGWFTEDFTLKEIKTLKAKERLATRSQENNGKFAVPSFAEVLQFVRTQQEKTGRAIGIYPELKHPTYFHNLGFTPEKQILAELKKAGLTPENQKVYIQCFESAPLKWLAKNSKWPLVQLLEKKQLPYDLIAQKTNMTVRDFTSDQGLAEIKKYAAGIGPDKRMILPADQDGKIQQPTDLVARAHKAGLIVHPYTFRSDAPFLAQSYDKDVTKEYEDFFELGVDGVFSDFTDHAVKARTEFLR